MRKVYCLLWFLMAGACAYGQGTNHPPVFITVSCSKTACYLHEPIMVEYKLFYKASTQAKISRYPAFPNGTVLQGNLADTSSVTSTSVNGNVYETRVLLRKWILPLVEGTFQPGTMVVAYKTPQAPPAGAGLQDLMNQVDKDQATAGKGLSSTASSPDISVKVQPLPLDGQPAGFSGAVGAFSISAAVDSASLATGKMAHLHVSVRGSGALMPGQDPVVSWPPDINQYDTYASDSVLMPPGVGRVITYAFMASKPGQLTVPPVAFTYFDPQVRAYKTVQSAAITLAVSGAPIVMPTLARAQKLPWYQQWLNFGAAHPLTTELPLLLIVAVGCFFLGRMGRHAALAAEAADHGDSAQTPHHPAVITVSYRNEPWKAAEDLADPLGKHAAEEVATVSSSSIGAPVPLPVDPFARAVELMDSGKYGDFYKALQEALWEALLGGNGDAGLPYPGIAQARTHLEGLGISRSRVNDAETVFTACAVSLYTPVHQASEAMEYLEKARAIAGPGGKYKSGPEN